MATQYEIDQWFSAIGTAGNYRTMHYFDGDGDVNRVFEINFEGGYINRADVKAFMTQDQTRETQVLNPIFQGPNSIRFNVAVPVGWTVLIYRDTPKAQPLSQFVDGAIINANNLDRNAKQAVFAVSEMVDRFDSTVEQVNTALEQVYQANLKADQAVATANAADAKANQAIQTANSADSKANQAILTANSATQTANGAVQTANGAVQTANEAKQVAEGIDGKVNQANQTAGEAKQIAEGIDAKATKALNDSAAAVQTANQATQTANGIDAKATKALADSAEALRKSNEAIAAGGIGAELVARVSEMPAGNNEVWWKAKQAAPEAEYHKLQLTTWGNGPGQIPGILERNVWRNINDGVASNIMEDTQVVAGSKVRTLRTRYIPDPSKWPLGNGNAVGIAWVDNYEGHNFYSSVTFRKDSTFHDKADFADVNINGTSRNTGISYFTRNGEALTLVGNSAAAQYISAYRDGNMSWRIGRMDTHPNLEIVNVSGNTSIGLMPDGVVSNKVVKSDNGFYISQPSVGSFTKVGHGGAWIDWTANQQAALQVDMKQDSSAYLVWRATHWGKSHVASCQVLSNPGGDYRVLRHNLGSTSLDMSGNGTLNMNLPGGGGWLLYPNGNLAGTIYGAQGNLVDWVNFSIQQAKDYGYSKGESDARYQPKGASQGNTANAGEVGQVAFLRVSTTVTPNALVSTSNQAVYYSDISGTPGWSVPSGQTWKCLGHQSTATSATLYVRVA